MFPFMLKQPIVPRENCLEINLIYFSFPSGVGWMQPLFPQLLHVSLGEAEQPLSPLPARLGCSENWQMRSEELIVSLQMLIPSVHTPAQCPTWQWLQNLVQSLLSWTAGGSLSHHRSTGKLPVPMKYVALNVCGIVAPNYMFHLWGLCHTLTLQNCPVMFSTSCKC